MDVKSDVGVCYNTPTNGILSDRQIAEYVDDLVKHHVVSDDEDCKSMVTKRIKEGKITIDDIKDALEYVETGSLGVDYQIKHFGHINYIRNAYTRINLCDVLVLSNQNNAFLNQMRKRKKYR